MKVEEIMSREVTSCAVEDMLDAAAQAMWDRRVGSVVVLTKEGRLAGMLTDRDVAMSAQTQGLPLKEIPVRVAMATEVEACRVEESVGQVLGHMRRRLVRRCPVVDQSGAVVGLVSLDDLAGAVARRRARIDPRELAAAFAATAAAEHGTADAELLGGAGRSALQSTAALAGEVGDRARRAWGRLRTGWVELGEERPDRPRAARIASRVVRTVARGSEIIQRRAPGRSEQVPPG